MSLWRMSAGQRERFEREEVERLPLGVWCKEDCDYPRLWEAPLEDWFEPKCPECMRPAILVEVVEW